MKQMKWLVVALLGMPLALGVAACGDNTDELEDEIADRIDCAQLCAKYDECIEDIDISACTDACEEGADADSDYEQAAENCEECLDDQTCEEADDAGCWNDCPVVPLTD